MRKQMMVLVLVVLAALSVAQVAAAQGGTRNDTFSLTGVVGEVGADYIVVDGQTIYFLALSLNGPGVQVGQTVYVQGFIAPDGTHYARSVRVIEVKPFDGPVVDSPVLFSR
ncbi:MAG: hypothetical protein JW910_01390 [Anaerolineae bacterium]|nr:hypothetical protein [Anaerolineae bacterium]